MKGSELCRRGLSQVGPKDGNKARHPTPAPRNFGERAPKTPAPPGANRRGLRQHGAGQESAARAGGQPGWCGSRPKRRATMRILRAINWQTASALALMAAALWVAIELALSMWRLIR